MELAVESRDSWRSWGSFVLVASLLSVSSPATAQEAADSPPPATTTVDATIPVDHLQVMLRPLTKDELTIELEGWLGLLRAKITEVGGVELKLKAVAKGATDDKLIEQLVAVRTEETDLAERARIVLDALNAKGGDVQAAQQYIDAVSDIGETTDATSRGAAIVAEFRNWVGRDDGGKFWAKRSLVAVVILLVFWMISKIAGRVMARSLSRHPRASTLLENFARRTAGGVVFVVGVMLSLATLGVPLGPLMALVGGGGFILGFALQETLGNFASGMLIMVYRPFDVNDYVSVAGVEGTVKEMSLVSTSLLTIDNKVLVIPNKKAWGDTITNFTGKDTRRVDLVFGIGYEDDIQHAINVLTEIASEHKLVLDDPAVMVHVDELADSSVNLFCRPWVKTKDYWAVHWDLTRQVKERFDAEGISIPFPQRDVHMHSESESVSSSERRVEENHVGRL
jgi:small conductance mechanosensitive channel